MIVPHLQGEAFLDSVRHARERPAHLHLWWLGQSGFLVQWRGQHLLFDPYLSDSLTAKYAATDKPHTRMTERVIEPGRLDFIHVVTSSHNHTDHLDGETLGPLLAANPGVKLVIPEANRAFVADRLGIPAGQPLGLTAGSSLVAGQFTIHGVPAAHNALDTDVEGRHKYLGYVVQAGPWVLYHSGDTLRYDGMVERLQGWTPDVAFLPINGNLPERRVAGNLNGREAAILGHDIRARMVIPCHYEMFEFNTASPEEFATTAREIGQPIRILRAGEHLELPPVSSSP